jgi:uncharacterized protein (TIGR04222 family)
MNPFDLAGPQFLLFYLAFGGSVILALAMLRQMRESSDSSKVNLTDPYLIAYLRGGKNEALRLGTVSLIDRGLLVVKGSRLRSDWQATDIVTNPVEKALLQKFLAEDETTSIYKSSALEAACQPYLDTLTRQGLLPDQDTRTARITRFIIGGAFLFFVAFTKIMVALARGRHNFMFLVLLTLLALFLAYKVSNPFRTVKGSHLLADLRTLFSSLKERASGLTPGGATGEIALLAAVFGIAALPTTVFPHAKTLYPRASSSSSFSSGSSCGTSCGSSCGGGGCGGGCGGCGS